MCIENKIWIFYVDHISQTQHFSQLYESINVRIKFWKNSADIKI